MKKFLPNNLHLLAALILTTCFLSCRKETTITHKAKPEITIHGYDSRLQLNNIHFVKDTVYILATDLVRDSGQIFSIDAGTLIKVQDKFTIIIKPNAIIEANGTETEPVVFTSATLKGSPGYLVNNSANDQSYWYGLNINGAVAVSSGKLNYVRIEFAGGYHGSSTDAPLTLYNVDKATSLHHIQVSYSFATPSFEFSGGNCHASDLVSYASSNSDFSVEDGYTGMLQNLLAYRHPYFAPAEGSGTTLAGLLINGTGTFPAISNLSVIGPDDQNGTSLKYYDTTSPGPFGSTNGSRVASLVVRGGKFHIRNSVFSGFPKGGFYMDETAAAISLQSNESSFTYSIVESNDRDRAFFLPLNIYPPYGSADFRDFMLMLNYNNQLFYNLASFDFTDPFNYDRNPDPLPNGNSVLLSGANFDGPVFSDPFFINVPYRGAVGADNWMTGWTNFLPLQTDYNN